jgi:flagellar basal body-associated protein FliL
MDAAIIFVIVLMALLGVILIGALAYGFLGGAKDYEDDEDEQEAGGVVVVPADAPNGGGA